MRQHKQYGQIFLSDKNYINKIIEAVGKDCEIIVEIGPGNGALTERLCKCCKRLFCVEVHKKFAGILNKRFEGSKNVKVINADILKLDLLGLGDNLVLVGNLPYHISKQLILYFIKNRQLIKKGFFMFQSEFVDKLIADVGTDGYGALACFVQYYANIKKMFKVPAAAFSPVPKVDSAVIEIDFNKSGQTRVTDEAKLFQIINFAFSQRRKKVINVLKQKGIKSDDCLKAGITPDDRAENVSLGQYMQLVGRDDVS